MGGINPRCWTGTAAGNNGARLRLGKRRVRSHHQNDDAENKQNPLPSACSFEQPCSSWAANSRMSYEGVPHIIDLGKSQAEAETEAQLVEQDCDPAVTHPHMLSAARCHLRPRPTYQAISSGPRQSARWTGFRRSRRRRAPWPVRPVTLRRHLSNGFAFVKIASNLADQIRSFSKPPCVRANSDSAAGFTPPEGSRSGTRSSRPVHPSRRN